MIELHELMEELTRTLATLTEKAVKAPELNNKRGTEFIENLSHIVVYSMKNEELFIRMVLDQAKQH